MIKLITVEDCFSCPYIDKDVEGYWYKPGAYYCNHQGSERFTEIEWREGKYIPKWCPLPDYVSGANKND